jgi:hypothetical protein
MASSNPEPTVRSVGTEKDMDNGAKDRVESPRDYEKKEADYGLKSPATMDSSILEKGFAAPTYGSDSVSSEQFNTAPETARDLATEVIHAKDDPSLSPWTFRTWFIGTFLYKFIIEATLTMHDRNGPFYLWGCSWNHLLLQTSDLEYIYRLFGRGQLCVG